MKKLFVVAAIMTLATAAAQAQQAKTKKAAASSKKKIVVASATTSNTATPQKAGMIASAVTQSTTTVVNPEVAATATKSWSLTFVNQTSVGADQLNYANREDKTYEALNYAGFGYKLNPQNRIGVRQYFTLNHDGDKGVDKTTMNDTVLTYTRSDLSGIFNSDKVSPTFWYYIPTSTASRDMNSNGNLRMDLEVPWTLTPKWTVSYYFNPRQNLIPNGTIVDAEGKESPVFAKTTLIHYGILYYNFSDAISTYGYAGYIHRWKTAAATLTDQEALLALGASFNLLGGKINLNPEISVTSVQVAKAKQNAAEQIVQEKNISYVMTSAFVF